MSIYIKALLHVFVNLIVLISGSLEYFGVYRVSYENKTAMKIVCHSKQANLYGNLLVSSEVSLFCSLIVRKGILRWCLFGLHRILVIILVNSDYFCISRTRALEDKWPQAQIPRLYLPSILWKNQMTKYVKQNCVFTETYFLFFFTHINYFVYL